jgi:hypothetical protein
MEETVALDSPPQAKDRKQAGRDQSDLPMVALERLTSDEEEAPSFRTVSRDLSFDADLGDTPEMPTKMEKQLPPSRIPGKTGKTRRSPILPIVIIILVLLAAAVGVAYFYFPDLIQSVVQFVKPTDTRTGLKDTGIDKLRIQPQSLESYFVKSVNAGELFIVKGNITNNYPTARGKILLQVSIFNSESKVILKKLAYAGNIFSDEELKNLTVEQIDTAMKNIPGKDSKNLKIEAGATIPFMVIYHNLPENAKDFSPDLISSSPVN